MNEYKFNDINIGLGESFEVLIADGMMDSFKEITGDINPLHTDCNYAKSKGYTDRVVYGMLISSFYSTLVGLYLPGKHSLLQAINISFNVPVFIGDRLIVYGEVTYINEAYKQLEIKAFITNQNNKKVSKAKIKASLYE